MAYRGTRSIHAVGWALAGVAALGLAACTGHLHPKGAGTSSGPANATDRTGTFAETIAAGGGVQLSAALIVPQHPAGSTLPLVVMPASWGANATEYGAAAEWFAQSGYIVISYAQRGFAPSSGQVDFGGADTQHDVTTVLDWALAHTPADARRIGMAGVSYGGGISLLAAEHDPRIKAVVAMSAWTDLSAMLAPNATVAAGTIGDLITSNSKNAFSAELTAAAQGVKAHSGTATLALAANPARSAITDVGLLNRNGTAVLIANDAQDSLVAPNQLVTFFDQLTGPKRLRLDIGGHGSSEVSGFTNAQAARTGVWKDALDWLDHYVRGIGNAASGEAAVSVHDIVTGRWFDYAKWPAGNTSASYSIDAGGAHATAATGSLGSTASTWSRSLVAGLPTAADSGAAQIAVARYTPPSTTKLTSVPVATGIVTRTTPLPTAERIGGTPTVHLNIAGASKATTVFVYLYDVDPTGRSTLISYAPYTVTGTSPGTGTPVDLPLRSVEWTVDAGHRLALAIDTADQRFLSSDPFGSRVTISSTTASPARLMLPLSG